MVFWLQRAAWFLWAPVLAVVTALHPRTRARWAERWAWRLPAVSPGAIWIHASSVGEGQAAAALCEQLRTLPSGPVLLRTASTDTGLATARGHHVLCARPVDAPWIVGRWLNRVRPRLLVLVEGDLWPNLLRACRARGIPVVVVGVRRGRGTARLRRWAPGLFRAMADCVSLWLVREEGLDLPGRVARVGELKGLPSELVPVPLPPSTLVAGSTREGEEAALLTAWHRLEPQPLLVLAPRHQSRFESVADLVGSAEVRWQRWSAGGPIREDCQVLLLDTVGDLARFYPQATAAFVGGTFSPEIGGHSPAEALAAGLPLVRGPHHGANRVAWEDARVSVAGTLDSLHEALSEALTRGRGARVQGTGAGEALEHLAPWLQGPVPMEAPLRPGLWFLAQIWRLLVAARAWYWSLRRPTRVKVPVISVGGLGSGGAGKTPVVAELVRRLEGRGRHPTVVARGHGRSGGAEVRNLEGEARASTLGDELAMLAGKGVSVVSAPDRVAGAREAIRGGADVIVLDDGFQHRRLHRDLDLVVVDPRWPTEGGLLPMGEAREGSVALGRADALWLSGPGNPAALSPLLDCIQSRVVPTGWVRSGDLLALEDLPAGPVTAVAGIARPGRFLDLLVALGLDVRGWHSWPDHHAWTPGEEAALIAGAEGTTLVCTEKDRVRLSSRFPGYALRMGLEVVSGQEALEEMLDRVLA